MENQVLDPSKLMDLLLDADVAWGAARAVQKTNLVAVAPTFKGFCDISDVTVPNFFRNNTIRTPKLTIAWIEACTGNPQYKTDAWVRGIPCDFEGWTVGTNKQEFEIKSYVEDSFFLEYKIYDNLFTTEQMFTNAYNKCIKGIIEKADEICIAKLVTYSGVNKFQAAKQMGKNGGTINTPTSWKTTDLPTLNLTAKGLASYVGLAKRMNRMVNPSLFVGGALEVNENIDGSLEKFNYGGLTVYSDFEHFPEQELTNDMFLVSNGAIAMLNTWNYSTTPTAPMGPEMEVYFSKALPPEYNANGYPIMVDIVRKFVKREISTGKYGLKNVSNQCEWVEIYNVRLSFETPLNPLSCNEGQTGVLHLHANDTLPYYVSANEVVFNHTIA